jgi:hypothetical protein
MHTAYYVKSNVVFYPTEVGGRGCMPRGDGYAPYIKVANSIQFAVRIYDIPSNAQFGDHIEVIMELMYYPKLDYAHLQCGTTFTILEGPKVIGEGVVDSEIYSETIKA